MWHLDIFYIYDWFIGFQLDITVMINILREITKILQEKMLKSINLNWFTTMHQKQIIH